MLPSRTYSLPSDFRKDPKDTRRLLYRSSGSSSSENESENLFKYEPDLWKPPGSNEESAEQNKFEKLDEQLVNLTRNLFIEEGLTWSQGRDSSSSNDNAASRHINLSGTGSSHYVRDWINERSHADPSPSRNPNTVDWSSPSCSRFPLSVSAHSDSSSYKVENPYGSNRTKNRKRRKGLSRHPSDSPICRSDSGNLAGGANSEDSTSPERRSNKKLKVNEQSGEFFLTKTATRRCLNRPSTCKPDQKHLKRKTSKSPMRSNMESIKIRRCKSTE